MSVGHPLVDQAHCVQQYLGALEVEFARLAEEPEPVTGPVANILRSRQGRRAAAFLEPDLLARDAPVHVPLEQEVTWCEEEVDLIEVRADEPFAEEEVLLRTLHEALMTATRRGL